MGRACRSCLTRFRIDAGGGRGKGAECDCSADVIDRYRRCTLLQTTVYVMDGSDGRRRRKGSRKGSSRIAYVCWGSSAQVMVAGIDCQKRGLAGRNGRQKRGRDCAEASGEERVTTESTDL